MRLDHERIIGTWHAEIVSDTSTTSIFRILDDFRFVSFAEDDRPEAKRRWIPMRLWGSFDDDDTYRLRPKKEAEGWTRQISFDGEVMVIKATAPEHRIWRCSKLAESEIPE
ncbi:MAG: hypothetical protein CMO55_11445 [Verrucomicrobiales bacterium]|nr:hypothetical protein [Verrucomicrobiales bacterium]